MRWSHVLILFLALLAGGIGAWCTLHYYQEWREPPTLHGLIRQELRLSTEQERRIGQVEADFDARKRDREGQMRAANARLAAAIEADKSYGPEVKAAIDDFHHAMGELQKETVFYVLAIRDLLEPEQQVRFDRIITSTLTEQAR